eukprot:1666545-Alexandrium_andersonii.AAC.1
MRQKEVLRILDNVSPASSHGRGRSCSGGVSTRPDQRPRQVGQLLNEAAGLVMSGIAMLLADIMRGLRAYGVPIAVSLVCAYMVCFLAK